MTAGNVLSVVLLTLLGVALFVALVILAVRFVLKSMSKYGITTVQHGDGKKSADSKTSASEEEPPVSAHGDSHAANVQSQKAVIMDRNNRIVTSHFGLNNAIRDKNGITWIVDAILLYIANNGGSAAFYSCHSTNGVFALIFEDTPFPGSWATNFEPIPLNMDYKPISLPLPPTSLYVVCPMNTPIGQTPQFKQKARHTESDFPEDYDDYDAEADNGYAGASDFDGEDSYTEDDLFQPIESSETTGTEIHTTDADTSDEPDEQKEEQSEVESSKEEPESAEEEPAPTIVAASSDADESSGEEDIPEGILSDEEFEEIFSWHGIPGFNENEEEEEPVAVAASSEGEQAAESEQKATPSDRTYKIVHDWQVKHPKGNRTQCCDDTELPMRSVNLWWDETLCTPENAEPTSQELCCIVREWQLMHKTDGTVSMCAIEVGMNESVVWKYWDSTLGKSKAPTNRGPITRPAPFTQKFTADERSAAAQKAASKRTGSSEDRSGPTPTDPNVLRKRRLEEYVKAYGIDPTETGKRHTPSEDFITAWRINHPGGRKEQCRRELGYSEATMDRCWTTRRKKPTPAPPAITHINAAAKIAESKASNIPAAAATPTTTPVEIIRPNSRPAMALPDVLLSRLSGTSFAPKSEADARLFREVVQWRIDNPHGAVQQCYGKLGIQKAHLIQAWWKFCNPRMVSGE